MITQLSSSETIYNIADWSQNDSDCKLSGENKAKIGICIGKTPENVTEPNIAFLEKILTSVNLNLLSDTLLIEPKTNTTMVNQIISQNSLSKLVFFGISSTELGWSMKLTSYKPKLIGSTHMVFCDTLQMIESNKTLKLKLWESLKLMFK